MLFAGCSVHPCAFEEKAPSRHTYPQSIHYYIGTPSMEIKTSNSYEVSSALNAKCSFGDFHGIKVAGGLYWGAPSGICSYLFSSRAPEKLKTIEAKTQDTLL